MRKGKYLIILLIIVLDQIVKALTRSALNVGESVDVIGKVLSFTYVQNTGAAFSMLSGTGWLLILLPIVLILFGFFYLMKHPKEHWTLPLAVSLAIGGGISNLIDRIAFGYVTDMIDVHFWPVFNVADIAICVGCGILIIYILRFSDSKEKNI